MELNLKSKSARTNMASIDYGNKSVRCLDGERYERVAMHLNICRSPKSGWRAVVAVLDGEYKLDETAVKKLELSKCPTSSLILELAALGMTIDEFVSYVTRTGDAILMEIFNVKVDVCIVDHPLPEYVRQEGSFLSLSVAATGIPEPQYQWYRDKSRLNEATDRHCVIRNVRTDDSGVYRCLVFQATTPVMSVWSNPCVVTVNSAPPLEVKKHPVPPPIRLGADALLTTEVWGPEGLTYQWFKARTALQDNEHYRGCQSNELCIKDINEKMLGIYQCRVSSCGQVVWTKAASLQNDERLRQSPLKYTASDKVALLIGCGDYRGDCLLNAPPNDVRTLEAIFQSLNFKVVSLLNLTGKELIAAVQEFKELVDKGVYCVFYFCGHGFEVAGQVYLVPCDAPHGYTQSHCVSRDTIRQHLLERDPGMLCIILDVCRRPRDGEETVYVERPWPVKHGNTIVVYSTSYGLAAYEDFHHGILVSHLKNFLGLPISVEEVFGKFREAIGNDPKVSYCDTKLNGKIQIPQVTTNITKTGMSFADPIVYTSQTAQYCRRREIWEHAHRIPKPRTVCVDFPPPHNFRVKVRLDFQQACSNALYIYTSVLDQGIAAKCQAWVPKFGVHEKLQEKMKIVSLPKAKDTGLYRSKVTLYNIQRLQDDLKICVQVVCQDPNVRQKVQVDNLGKPLISVLRLWEERPEFTTTRHRIPQEVQEYSWDTNGESSLSSSATCCNGGRTS